MKEILNKFYNININDYKEYNNGIIFMINSENYYLCKIDNIDMDKVLDLYNYVKNISNIKLHTIVINNNGNIVSEGYILYKLNVVIEDIDYNDVINFNLCNVNDKYYISFVNEWINKIDYFDSNINELELLGSYDYFKGIIESLIKYISDFDSSRYKLCLSHNKMCFNTIEYYNPINLCVDIIYRDIVSYVRCIDDFKNINKYIDTNDFNLLKYVFVYLVLPSEYFDLLENDINGIKEYIGNIDNYEKYLLEIEELFNIYIFEHIKRSN